MSPIEHVMELVDRHFACYFSPISSTDVFWIRIQRIWNARPQAYNQNVFGSLSRRIAALVAACGGYTK